MTNRSLRQRIQRTLAEYTASDQELSGLPDPLNEAPHTDDPEALKAWEQHFYQAIAADEEFWRSRSIASLDDMRQAYNNAGDYTPPPDSHPRPRPRRQPLFTWMNGITYRWSIGHFIELLITKGDADGND